VVIAVHRGEGDCAIPMEAAGKILLSCGEASFTEGVLTLGEESFCVMR
jgi:hypothetical protein